MSIPTVQDLAPTLLNFREEVLKGLTQPQKTFLPQFLFHDERGSDLFNQICELDEYYQTRSEKGILRDNSQEIAEYLGEKCLLIEYGSGSVQKVQHILNALASPAGYVPIDIAKEHLQEFAKLTETQYPNLDVLPLVADYTQDLRLPTAQKAVKRKVIFFAGSTIGNLTQPDAIALLKRSAKRVGQGGGMLIGVDLKKDPAILHVAYNDALGITAQFNLNVLQVINRELNADFVVEDFYHYAPYNPSLGRIEMHLISKRQQQVRIGNDKFFFEEGESIHTENSYKYSTEDFRWLAQRAGFELKKTWKDANNFFSLNYLECVA